MRRVRGGGETEDRRRGVLFQKREIQGPKPNFSGWHAWGTRVRGKSE